MCTAVGRLVLSPTKSPTGSNPNGFHSGLVAGDAVNDAPSHLLGTDADDVADRFVRKLLFHSRITDVVIVALTASQKVTHKDQNECVSSALLPHSYTMQRRPASMHRRVQATRNFIDRNCVCTLIIFKDAMHSEQ